MLPKLLRAEKDKVVERKNNMSKYNLTDILNEYIGGGRIGTLKTSYRDLVDIMDKLEKSDKVIVRELPGPSGDGKTNREFEVVDRDSAVAGGRKQERGFTVYDYKFGFDPGSIDNYEEEYDFSVGGNDLKLAMELIPDVKPYRLEELDIDSIQNDPGSGDADNPTGEELEASGGYDAAMEESHCYDEDDINEGEFDEARQAAIESSQEKAGIKINEGDLFSSEFDRAELKDIINDLNKGLILDMPTRRAYKFLVSLLDKEDKEELGVNEQMYIDDEEFNKEMGRSKKDALRQEMMFHVNQLMDGNIDKNDFMNVVEDIMMDLGLKEVMGVDRKGNKKPDTDGSDAVKFKKAAMSENKMKIIDAAAKMIKDRILKDVPMDIVVDFVKTHIQDLKGMSNSEIKDEFEEFRSVNYDYIDEDLKAHFNRFK